MKILALDAATEACSAALFDNGVVTEGFQIAPRRHAQLLLPMALELLADAGYAWADLDALAFGRGPGAFTGLRIAAGMVQGLALGADLPVVPVSNLAALAARCLRRCRGKRVLVVNDARMGEVYWAGFAGCADRGPPVAVAAEQLSSPAWLGEQPLRGDWQPAGNGWAAYPDALAVLARRLPPVREQHPHAEDIARLAAVACAEGAVVAADQALPVYIRDQVVQRP